MLTPKPLIVWNVCAPLIVSAVPEPAFTVTCTGADVTVLLPASRPTAVSVCEPPDAVIDAENGALVSSGPAFAPSTRNCTAMMLPDAEAATENGLVTVAPPDGDVIDTLLGDAAAVKSWPGMSALLTVTFRLFGENVKPLLLGITAYDPLSRPLNVNAPEPLAVVVAVAAPPRLTVEPAPLACGVIVPEIEYV